MDHIGNNTKWRKDQVAALTKGLDKDKLYTVKVEYKTGKVYFLNSGSNASDTPKHAYTLVGVKGRINELLRWAGVTWMSQIKTITVYEIEFNLTLARKGELVDIEE